MYGINNNIYLYCNLLHMVNNPVSGNRLSGQQETASPDRGNRKNLITRADSYRVHKLLALKCPSVDQCL